MQVKVIENVLKLNDEVAMLNRSTLRDAGVFTVDLIGGPGCGKTSLLEVTLRELAGTMRIGVIAGDLATTRDADRLAKWSQQVVQINTGKGCHLDANQVRQAIAQLDVNELDLLIVENVGNLICPVGFDLGQDVKVGMFSLAEGDDKAAKHPYIVAQSSVLLLNKMDLLEHVPFNLNSFRNDVRSLNPDVQLLEISVMRGDMSPWLNWLTTHATRRIAEAT